MHKIKRNDTVLVIAGRDKGKKGKVLHMFYGDNRAIVEGVNLVKRHKRRTQQDQQAGIAQVPSTLSSSSLMLVCKNCNKPTRVGFITLADGTKSRICKKCKEPV